MKQLLTIILISFAALLVGCESSSDGNALTPVLNEAGIQQTNDSGEPLYTNSDGTVGTEAELNTTDEPTSGGDGTSTTNPDSSDDINTGNSGNADAGEDLGEGAGNPDVGF